MLPEKWMRLATCICTAILLCGPSPLSAAQADRAGMIRLAAIGDSTIAQYPDRENPAVPSLIPGVAVTVVAKPGNSIEQQNTAWLALPNKQSFGVVVIEIGLNDMNPAKSAKETIRELQNLVDAVRRTIATKARLAIAQMTPAAGRWSIIYGADAASTVQRKWEAVNEAIAGRGPTPIHGVDIRITGHVRKLADSEGRIRKEYNPMGDEIHPNRAGRMIIADAWRIALKRAGIFRN